MHQSQKVNKLWRGFKPTLTTKSNRASELQCLLTTEKELEFNTRTHESYQRRLVLLATNTLRLKTPKHGMDIMNEPVAAMSNTNKNRKQT